jgi:lipid A ethanolaminephosphotransferase
MAAAPPEFAHGFLQERHRRGRALLAGPTLVAAVALFIVAVDNDVFWRTAWRATADDAHRAAILCSLFAIAFFTLTTLLSLAVGRKPFKAVAAVLLFVAANCGYFMSQYGVIIDEAMIRNAVETTALESAPLLGSAYVWHIVLYALLPSVVVVVTPLPTLPPLNDAAARIATVLVGAAALIGILYANYGAMSYFAHQNRSLRLLINPAYPLYAAATFGMTAGRAPQRVPLDVRRSADAPRKPAVVVLVMGETARADRFSLNGYRRDTNRYTREHGVVNFPRVRSCGTSTADSLPCLFSGLGRARFTHAAASRRETVFGALQRLGVATFWRDNSTGCKGVCDAQHFEERATWTHPSLCDGTGCFDEVLLEGFDELLADRSRDHFVVLHQRGSHGPAYHTDVPQWAKEFAPGCDLPNLRNCSPEAVDNSYDNTILYTDYFLSRVIDLLARHDSSFDVAMIYVSDHGESLGENGLYLHGFPYAMAPREQIEVPMMIWASPGFFDARARIDAACLRRSAERPATHDAIFHTLLPLFGVESPLYDPKLDLFAACREHGVTALDR